MDSEINKTEQQHDNVPIPVALCGKTEQIGRIVIKDLKPEYEVIHFIMTPSSGAAILPALLTGQPPPQHPDSSSLGSGNYAAAPRAIILGSAFDDAALETLKSAVTAAAASSEEEEERETREGGERRNKRKKALWLRQDLSKPKPPFGPEYGRAMVERIKEALSRLGKEGKLDGTYEGDEWY